MGAKGSKKVLDVPQIEKTVIQVKSFVSSTMDDIVTVNSEITKLKEGGLENMVGGQGDEIVKGIAYVEQGVTKFQQSVSKISKIVDTKLTKVVEAYHDKYNATDASSKAQEAKVNMKMQRH